LRDQHCVLIVLRLAVLLDASAGLDTIFRLLWPSHVSATPN
jgi:hypothetical protein